MLWYPTGSVCLSVRLRKYSKSVRVIVSIFDSAVQQVGHVPAPN